MASESYQINIRLTKNQKKALEDLAYDKNLSLSAFCRYLLLEKLDEYFNDMNLLHGEIHNLKEKLDEISNSQNFSQQFFHAFLINWFVSHPKISNISQSQMAEAEERLLNFDRYFIQQLFANDMTLFNQLYSKMEEGSGSDEQ